MINYCIRVHIISACTLVQNYDWKQIITITGNILQILNIPDMNISVRILKKGNRAKKVIVCKVLFCSVETPCIGGILKFQLCGTGILLVVSYPDTNLKFSMVLTEVGEVNVEIDYYRSQF